jgi:hypothetical protein
MNSIRSMNLIKIKNTILKTYLLIVDNYKYNEPKSVIKQNELSIKYYNYEINRCLEIIYQNNPLDYGFTISIINIIQNNEKILLNFPANKVNNDSIKESINYIIENFNNIINGTIW